MGSATPLSRPSRRRGLLAGTLGLLLVVGVIGAARAATPVSTEFRLTITNRTDPAVPLREGAFLLHRQPHQFWQAGSAANEATERIAEIGTGLFAVLQLGAVEMAADTEHPGASPSWLVRARPGDLFSFAQMPAPTNDGFVGVDSLALFEGHEPRAAQLDLIVWDAGT